MSQAEQKELENDEECNAFADEEIEVPEDEIHDEYEGDDGEPKEIRANMCLQDISVKYSTFHRVMQIASVDGRNVRQLECSAAPHNLQRCL